MLSGAGALISIVLGFLDKLPWQSSILVAVYFVLAGISFTWMGEVIRWLSKVNAAAQGVNQVAEILNLKTELQKIRAIMVRKFENEEEDPS